MSVRLLLIEDNPGDVVLLREKLNAGDLDYELIHVDRLAEALDVLAVEPIDLLFCDLSLPDAHGLEAVRAVRTARPDRPLIVLTGLDDAGMAAEARREGATDYLVKWFVDSVSLARYVRYAIAQYEEADEPAPEPPAPAPDGVHPALDAAPDGLAVLAGGNRILWANARMRILTEGGERLPWPAEDGQVVRVDGTELVARSRATRWDGQDVRVVTLRAAPAPEERRPAPPNTAPPLALAAAEAALAAVEQAEALSHWAADILRDALALHRIENVRHESLNLAERVALVARDLRPMAMGRGVPLRAEAARKTIMTRADRRLLDRLVRRLLTDALIEASPAGVTLEARVVGAESVLDVTWEPDSEARAMAPLRTLSADVVAELVRLLDGVVTRTEHEGRPRVVVRLAGPGGGNG